MQALLDAFGIDWKLLIAQAVNFGILFVALWLLLYRPVMKALDERRALVAKGVEDAKKAEEKLKGADSEASSIVGKADEEAAALLSFARETATAEKARIVKEAEERAAKIAQEAEARAAETAARARKESEKEIAALAILAAEKVLKERV
jgi:F-type H+-transporting ATPase subunit b